MCTQAYEEEVRSKGTGVNRSIHRLFDTLAGRGTTVYTGKTFGEILMTVITSSSVPSCSYHCKCCLMCLYYIKSYSAKYFSLCPCCQVVVLDLMV